MSIELEVNVSYATARTGVPSSASFRKWVAAALEEREAPASVAIRIVAPDEGRELNRTYRGKDYATNVLSFPAERPEGLPADIALPDLGDLVICADVVAREAAEQGKKPADHYAHLTVHGVLHLLGWDHQDDDEAEAMESRESTILAGLGIADPY
ncbi:rRNA maturation RNase YbeY [Lysobacter sp. TY2-98]|uniref:rRNA maturation RNase YbeY n=1 Tax=Lysobacter sp. TY2-98 TaxID=2290922 RepID=UPI001F07E7FD|nr:rRNA maturation RNase YbeY [Lysobacter sp. TY2-98]